MSDDKIKELMSKFDVDSFIKSLENVDVDTDSESDEPQLDKKEPNYKKFDEDSDSEGLFSSDDEELVGLDVMDEINEIQRPEDIINIMENLSEKIEDVFPISENPFVESYPQHKKTGVLGKDIYSSEIKSNVESEYLEDYELDSYNIMQPSQKFKVYPLKGNGYTDVDFVVQGKSICIVGYEIRENSTDRRRVDTEIGLCHSRYNKKLKIKVPITLNQDYFDRAEYYNEKIQGKGTGFGYSSFCHSLAIFMIMQNNSYLEPHEGYDFTMEISGKTYTCEMTGFNFSKRQTGADFVFNKYDIIYCYSKFERLDERMEKIISMARMEEERKVLPTKVLESPYTENLDKIKSQIYKLDDNKLKENCNYFLTWTREQMISKQNELNTFDIDKNSIKETILKLSNLIKSLSKKDKFHSPFRVTNMGKPKFVERVKTFELYSGGNYSFHTIDSTEEYDKLVISKCTIPLDYSFNTEMVNEQFTNFCNSYNVVQSSSIESDLISKIRGNQGSYYSEFNNNGIYWKKMNKRSQLYYVYYFNYVGKPNSKLFGEWNEEKFGSINFYRSPTFKLNIRDINFKLVVSKRIKTIISSSMDYYDSSDFAETLESMMSIFSIWNSSTWNTSKIASDFRFSTTRYLSGYSDYNLLFNNLTISDNFLNFSDSYLLQKMVDSLKRVLKEGVCKDRTPVFNLPIRYQSLEKDFALGTNWHIRNSKHANNCMKKLIEGLKKEEISRKSIVDNYSKQLEYLCKLNSGDSSYSDFKFLIEIKVEHPLTNYPMFLAQLYLSGKQILGVMNSQINPGFQLTNMISVRSINDMMYKKNKIIKSSNVARELSTYLKEKNCKGAYELLVKTIEDCDREDFNYVYSIFEKDAKSSDREIPVSFIDQRIMQLYIETQSSIISNSMDEDFLLDTKKYYNMVKTFIPILQSESYHIMSSEDRSFHSGYMHPEAMSVCLYSIGKICSVNSLISSSYLMSMNKRREIIFPYDYDNLKALDDLSLEYSMISRLQRNKINKTPKITMYYHMMQGQFATTAGVLNTIYNVGFSEAFKLITKSVISYSVVTTSDDAARAYEFKTVSDVKRLCNATVDIPLENLDRASMVNNVRKHVKSGNQLEINNIMIVPNGMVHQSLIHCCLSIQPLLGENVMDDIISCISNSRSLLFWGDGPSVCASSLVSNIELLKNKWLINDADFEKFKLSGLIPNSIEELIEGFVPRSSHLVNMFWENMQDSEKEDYFKGIVPLNFGFCKKLREDQKIKKSKIEMTGVDYIDRKLKSVKRSLELGGLINKRNIGPQSLKKTIESRDKFLSFFKKSYKQAPKEVYNIVKPKYKVHISLTKLRKKDTMPCIMGTSAKVDLPNIKKVDLYKKYKIYYKESLNEKEMNLLTLNDEDYEKEVKKVEESLKIEGFKIRSPSGLPVVRLFEQTIYKQAMAFNFSINVEELKTVKNRFMYKGIKVQDFKPIFWGQSSLNDTDDEDILAFGLGTVDGEKGVFYKLMDRPVRFTKMARTVDSDENQESLVRRIKEESEHMNVAYILERDSTPIAATELIEVNEVSLPCVRGDTNAILNYGSYLHSNNKSSFSIYKRVLNYYNSDIPNVVVNYMLSYPTFSEDSLVIDSGSSYILEGLNCINKLKLELNDKGKEQLIDLKGELPKLVLRNTMRRKAK